MKKKHILLILLLIAAIILLSSCGNKQIFDTTWNFKRAYIRIGDQWKEMNISSWRDYDDSDVVQITSETGTTYLTHYNNVVLVAY